MKKIWICVLASALMPLSLLANIWGTVTSAAGPVAGAKLVLITPGGGIGPPPQRVDSAVSSTTGSYSIGYSVAVTTAGFTIIVTAPGYDTLIRTNVTVNSNPNLNNQNFVLIRSVVALDPTAGNAQPPRMHWLGDRLAVELGYSIHNRAVEIYGLNGILKRRFLVSAGESRVLLSAESAPLGTLLRVK